MDADASRRQRTATTCILNTSVPFCGSTCLCRVMVVDTMFRPGETARRMTYTLRTTYQSTVSLEVYLQYLPLREGLYTVSLVDD